ncbi:MAG: hypothetical protein WKF58_11910 [Ilumatobacteraceae bacterium]
MRNPMRRAGFDPGDGADRATSVSPQAPRLRTDAAAGRRSCSPAELGVADVLVKDEYERFGLPAFKMLGASWATYRALEAHRRAVRSSTGTRSRTCASRVAELGPLTLATATDGNHGRAVARDGGTARPRLRGSAFPNDTVAARIDAIAGEGAEVTISSRWLRRRRRRGRRMGRRADARDLGHVVGGLRGRARRGSSTATRRSSPRSTSSSLRREPSRPRWCSSPSVSARSRPPS